MSTHYFWSIWCYFKWTENLFFFQKPENVTLQPYSKMDFKKSSIYTQYPMMTTRKQAFSNVCKCIIYMFSDTLLWDSKLSSGASCFHWSSLRCFYTESFCGEFNWLYIIWKGTYLSIYGVLSGLSLNVKTVILSNQHVAPAPYFLV